MKNTNCQPAASILERLGLSQNEIARRLKVMPSTVNRWKLDSEHGGCGGNIPVRYWRPLKLIARQQRVKLTSAELAGEFVEDAAR